MLSHKIIKSFIKCDAIPLSSYSYLQFTNRCMKNAFSRNYLNLFHAKKLEGTTELVQPLHNFKNNKTQTVGKGTVPMNKDKKN